MTVFGHVRRSLANGVADVQEVGSMVAAAALYPAGWFDRGPGGRVTPQLGAPVVRAPVDGWSTPVLLVHGWMANKSNWLVVERELRRAGFDEIHAMSYRPFPLDVAALGARCAERARQVMEATGSPRIHLVGHSLGGVISRWAVQVEGLHEALTVQTIASPHGGTPLAGINRRAKSAAQLCIRSSVLARTQQAPPPPDTQFVAYWSELDLLVPPPLGEIRGSGLDVDNIRIPRQGHVSIVLSRRVGAAVADHAAAAERRTVGPVGRAS